MTAVECVKRFHFLMDAELLDAPTDEATISYLRDRLNEVEQTVIDEYNVVRKSAK